MSEHAEERCDITAAVGSGGSLTYEVVRQYEATYGLSLLRSFAGVVVAAIPAFVTPPAAGAVLVFKGKPEHRQTAQWVHEGAVHPYAPDMTPGTPWKEQLLRVKDVLQLTVGDLARFAGVERPSVYHWLSGAQPRPAKQRRIDAMEHVARTWTAHGLGPIRAYLTRTVRESNNTLEALLTQDDLSLEAIEAHINALAGLSQDDTRSRPSVSERLAARGFKPAGEENYRKQRGRFVRSTSSGEE